MSSFWRESKIQSNKLKDQIIWHRGTGIRLGYSLLRDFCTIHAPKLTVRLWKKGYPWYPKRKFIFQPLIFRGEPNSFRKGTHHQSNHRSTQSTSRGPCRTFLQLLVQAMLKLLWPSQREKGEPRKIDSNQVYWFLYRDPYHSLSTWGVFATQKRRTYISAVIKLDQFLEARSKKLGNNHLVIVSYFLTQPKGHEIRTPS